MAGYAEFVKIIRPHDLPATLKTEQNRSRYEYGYYHLDYANAKADDSVKNEARSGSPDPKCGERSFRCNAGDCDKEHHQYRY